MLTIGSKYFLYAADKIKVGDEEVYNVGSQYFLFSFYLTSSTKRRGTDEMNSRVLGLK